MGNLIGKVLDKSNTREFSFVATEYFDGEFVEVEVIYSEDKKATIVGEIISKEAINPYFEKPSVINYLGEGDESITSWNLYIVKVKPIAVVGPEGIKKLDFPPPPGTNVYSAEESIISRVFGLENQGIPIGHLKPLKNLKIPISEDLLCRTHFSILGRTGSGKSYFARGLTKCIKDRTLIIFSPTEEYNEIAKDINAQVFSKMDLLLPLNGSYIASIYGLTLQEKILFDRFMEKEKSLKGKKTFSNQELAYKFSLAIQPERKEVEQTTLFDMKSKLKIDVTKEIPRFANTILSKIESKSLLFSNHPMKVPFAKSTIIDMSELENESQEVIMMYVLSTLLESYKDEKKRRTYPKVIVVIEEAHNFAPSVKATICKNKIIQLAREGRKLGIALSLISQRPRHLDQTVLSQCGTLFLFHLPHPDDIEHVFGISPIYRRDLIDTVRELMVGDCLVLGDATKYPLICSVNF
jgi:DNA helicase HerA-like ATPase